jgi:hypothetical protein
MLYRECYTKENLCYRFVIRTFLAATCNLHPAQAVYRQVPSHAVQNAWLVGPDQEVARISCMEVAEVGHGRSSINAEEPQVCSGLRYYAIHCGERN